MSISRGMDKEDVVHIYNGILLSHKKNKIMQFAATWMDLEIIKTKQSKPDKDKYHMISLLCGILKNDTNEFICKTERDSQILKSNLRLPKAKHGGK